MGMLWYPEGFEIIVDNPGYGQVFIRGDHGEWERDLAGGDVGAFLTQLTFVLPARLRARLSGRGQDSAEAQGSVFTCRRQRHTCPTPRRLHEPFPS